MIQPIVTANQAITNKTLVTNPVSFSSKKMNDCQGPCPCPPAEGYALATNSALKGEKLDINFEGIREHKLNGNKVDYFA